MRDWDIKIRVVKYRITWKIKGTRAKEESNRLREKIKGADSAKGENKMHEGGK